MDFLSLLRDALRPGLAACDSAFRVRHATWLAAQQDASGGFFNRRGRADLYYTAFALRSLSALNALSPEIAARAAGFLDTLRREDASRRVRQPSGAFCDAVAATSWWDSLQLCEEVLGPRLNDADRTEARAASIARLTQLARDDGGIAKSDMDASGSLYHTLLASSLRLRWGESLSDAARAATFVRGLRAAELKNPDGSPAWRGGFIENRFSKRPGTNGSAAGVVLSTMLSVAVAEAASETELQQHAAFLKSLQSDEGGWLATPGAPMADLLSTFAAMFVLQQLNMKDARAWTRAKAFAQSLELEEGGYVGFALEQNADSEYTFYGLGVMALANG